MLRLEREGAVTTLILSRPERRNAISRELSETLGRAVRISGATSKVLVVAAEGPVFSAGGDLQEFAQLGFEASGADAVLGMFEDLRALEDTPAATIVLLEGPAFGGAAELILLADLIVAEEHAEIAFRHTRMGLSPAWGGGVRLRDRVGSGRALDLLLTSREVGSAEALTMGLVDRCVPTGEGRTSVQALARSIADGSPESIAALKAAARRGTADLASQTRIEQAQFRALWGKTAHRTAMANFAGRGKKNDARPLGQ